MLGGVGLLVGLLEEVGILGRLAGNLGELKLGLLTLGLLIEGDPLLPPDDRLPEERALLEEELPKLRPPPGLPPRPI